MNPRWCHLLL
jgi:hypothetical protein